MSGHVDILFVFLETPYGDLNGFGYHVGTARIIWNLRYNGLVAEQYYREENLPISDLVEDILQKKPRFVGFSCYDVHFPLIATIASHLKRKCERLKIVIGGPTAMFSDEVILTNYPQIDYCIRGEGEEASFELLTGTPLYKILGLSFIKEGAFVRNPIRSIMSEKELNAYPSVYTDDLIPLRHSDKIGMMTSTGCAYQCTYCHFSVLTGKKVRFFSDEHVINELSLISQYWTTRQIGNVTIPIVDEAFTLNKKRALRLCKKIEKLDLPIALSCGTRGDYIDEEILEALWAAGVRALFYGLESGAPEVLSLVWKAGKPDAMDSMYYREKNFINKIKKNVILAKKFGFNVSVSAIFGLPGESMDEAMQTLDLITELDVPYMHNILQVYRGTRLWHDKSKYGISTSKFNNRWHIPHNTKTAYDVRNVPILLDRDRVFSNMRRNEIHAVLTSLVGPEQCPSVISMPILMRNVEPSLQKISMIGLQGNVGARLVLCDMGGYKNIDWLSDFVYSTSPPILLESVFDDKITGVELRRIEPLLDNSRLGYNFLLVNASSVFEFDSELSTLYVNTRTVSMKHQAIVMFFGRRDITLLSCIAKAIKDGENILYRHNSNIIKGLFGDAMSIIDTEIEEVEGHRVCFGRDGCLVGQAGLLFQELTVLRKSELQQFDVIDTVTFLIRLVRALQLVMCSFDVPLKEDDSLLLKMTTNGILGFHQEYAFKYVDKGDTLEIFPDVTSVTEKYN